MTTINQGSKPRLGFIGLGAMGSRMAGRLLAAGYDLTVYNRNREARSSAGSTRRPCRRHAPRPRGGRGHHPLVAR